MSNPYILIVYFLSLFIITSCASKKEESHDHAHEEAETDWKEMDAFHLVMAETFHPYKDSSNLEPAKSRATELMTAAEQWASAKLPAKVDNPEMKAKLRQLKSEAEALAENVRTADENVIAEQLTKVHDTFHEIQEAWYGGH
jgi:hypothetical protein